MHAGAHFSALFPALFAVLFLGFPLGDLSTGARRGREIVERTECTRCHGVTDPSGGDRGLPPPKNTLLRTGARVPDLGTLTRRVRPAFVRRFLDGPFDLRPHLEASMIPLRLNAGDKDAVVAYLVELAGEAVARGEPEPPVSPARVAAGRSLFFAKGCPTCHLYGNRRFNPRYDRPFFISMRRAVLLAPNLRRVRERIPRAVLLRFVQNPATVDPKAMMPKLEVTPAEAEALADFVLHGEISYAGARPVDPDPPLSLLDRPVRYGEVRAAVFEPVCLDCHGEGGPGDTGGLGFAGVRLRLDRYAAVRRGGVRQGLVRRGEAIDVLRPAVPGGEPLLLKALLRRRHEAERDDRPPYADAADPGPPTDPKHPGMPLGRPPLSVEQLRLVKTWLSQGAPE